MYESKGWEIHKQEQYPSDNYCLIPTHQLTVKEHQKLLEGVLPSNKVAYYGSYNVALKSLMMMIVEEMIIKEKCLDKESKKEKEV